MISVEDLPTTTGVYLFKIDNKVIYVGKSVNIKARVKSHIENAKHNSKEAIIIGLANTIESIITDSEFKALLLESELIKKFQPKYNVSWKDGKSFLYIKVTVDEKFPKIILARKDEIPESKSFGPFSSSRIAYSIVKEIRKIIPFCTQKKLSSKECFYSKISLCNPCPNAIWKEKDLKLKSHKMKIYRKNIIQVIKILSGKSDVLLSALYKKLNLLSKNELFEEAIGIRDRIIKLERLSHLFYNSDFNSTVDLKVPEELDMLQRLLKNFFPLINTLKRIECYDVSNISNIDATASMVVLKQGFIEKSEYRKFRIKSPDSISDINRLEEVLKRRLKQKWPMPNLIIVDGGKPQTRIFSRVLSSLKLNTPLVGIAKHPDRLIIGVSGFPTCKLNRDNPALHMIQRLRDESHRFAKKYHLFLRKDKFLP